MSTAPHVDIDVPSFWNDPYPTLATLRRDAPIAFIPQLGATVLASRDDIFAGPDEQADGPQPHAQGRR